MVGAGCDEAPGGSCEAALQQRRTANSAPCYEDRCEYLRTRPELEVSFRLSLRTPGDDTGLSSERVVHERQCVASLLRDSGLDVLSDDEFPNDVIAAGKWKEVQAALRLDIVVSVEPGCVGGCAHCRSLGPGNSCDEDPFCQTVFGQSASVVDDCVRFGELQPVVCLDDNEPCEERSSLALDPSGTCWYFDAADCPTLAQRGWQPDECVPWTAMQCSI